MANNECYMCPSEGVTREHVPPKCFFPAECRENLITVPSCNDHNNGGSLDVQYTWVIILTSISVAENLDNLPDGVKELLNKALGTLERNDARLAQRLRNNFQRIRVNSGETIAYEFERERFDNIIHSIAHSLYFFEYGKKYEQNSKLSICTPNILYSDLLPDIYAILFDLIEKKYVTSLSYKGDNQVIFKYSFINLPKNPLTKKEILILKMVFYNIFTVWVTKEGDITEDMLDCIKPSKLVTAKSIIVPVRRIIGQPLPYYNPVHLTVL